MQTYAPSEKLSVPLFHEFYASPAYADIRLLRENISNFLQNNGIDDDCSQPLLLAVTEIVTNLIKHPAKKASRFSVRMEITAHGIELDVADDSTPFATFDAKCNALIKKPPAVSTLSENGYGLSCILRQHPHVFYETADVAADGLNHFRICERRAPNRKEKKVVFIVDDDPVALKINHRILSAQYDVAPFSNARDLLETCRQRMPDLIISDLDMPGMNGADLRRALGQEKNGNLTPFVFLSAHHAAENSSMLLKMGIDDFLQKPVTPEKLLNVAGRLLHRARQTKTTVESNFHQDLDIKFSAPLPRHAAGWHISFKNSMAESGGGDFILHRMDHGNLAAVIADVMGHGRQAKFFAYAYAGYLRSLFRLSASATPAEFLEKLAAIVADDDFLESVSVTCQSFRLTADGKVIIASAGHPPPILVDDHPSLTNIHGPLPHLKGDAPYQETTLQLAPGQKILIASDGFFDVFPDGRLLDLARRHHDLGHDQLCNILWQAIETHRRDGPAADDMTLIIAEYGGPHERQ